MNDDDQRELDAYRDERARTVRPIWIETDRHDDRLRSIVVRNGNTQIATVQMNLRELVVIRRLIERELLGVTDENQDARIDAALFRIADAVASDSERGAES